MFTLIDLQSLYCWIFSDVAGGMYKTFVLLKVLLAVFVRLSQRKFCRLFCKIQCFRFTFFHLKVSPLPNS